jgi:molybdopterin-guanine dinucleotide biosynthesis protein A
MNTFEGFILAGGASSRMGTDKSQLRLAGQTLIERVRDGLATITDRIAIVGTRETSAHPSLPHLPDVVNAWGALGGVHSALSACTAEWAIVVACDLPFVSGDLFARLAGFREGSDAVAPVQADGWPQPLCAFYRVTPCLEVAEKLIAIGERRPVTLLQSVRTRWIAFDEIRDLGGADRFFDNMNTPDDYARALEKGRG